MASPSGSYPLPTPSRRIYCSRTLRLDQVDAVGFDMDYTLAIYRQAEMDRLSIDLTLARLVEMGYPERLLGLQCDPSFAVRGLLVDTKLGNILKMDRYRYVKRAYHGTSELGRVERKDLYNTRRPAGGDRYVWVDTLYHVPEVAVYAYVVSALDSTDSDVDYRGLYRDVRAAIDAAHQSGEVFAQVAADLDRYVDRDTELASTLDRLCRADKRLFLLTNSQPASTEVLMTYLLGSAWSDYFDVTISSAAKPGWFSGREPFRSCDGSPVQSLEPGRMYLGGNIETFEQFFGAEGAHVLYVGDHIYGDVLRASISSGWRTLLVIQELADELRTLDVHRPDLVRLDELTEQLDRLHDEMREGGSNQIVDLREHVRSAEDEIDRIEAKVDNAFHPYWGSLFLSGTSLSSMAWQVQQYAWLYTDRVSNLGAYSPLHRFRSPRARLAHML